MIIKNKFKGYSYKTIIFKNHKEFTELEEAIIGNELEKAVTILFKIYKEKRLKWD